MHKQGVDRLAGVIFQRQFKPLNQPLSLLQCRPQGNRARC